MTPHPVVYRKCHFIIDDSTINTRFDPKRYFAKVIEEAHSRNIVIAWFEYGFASQYGNSNSVNYVLQLILTGQVGTHQETLLVKMGSIGCFHRGSRF